MAGRMISSPVPAEEERKLLRERAGGASDRENRYIYNGDAPPRTAPYVIRSNKRAARRKVSTFTMIAVLLGIGFSTVVFVNNVITINRLSREVGDLQKRYYELMNLNAALRVEVNKKAAWERIGPLASGQLELRYPTEQPGWIDVDQEKLDELKSR